MDEQPEWLKILLDCLGRIALCILISYIGYKVMGGIGILLTVPAWGVMSAKPIMSFLSWCYTTTSQMPIKPYNGNYYEYAQRQIRIFIVDNKLWCVDVDVLKVIDEKPSVMLESLFSATEYDKIPGTKFNGFSETGVEKVLAKSKHIDALGMLHWFRRDVKKLHYRKLELARDAAMENGSKSR